MVFSIFSDCHCLCLFVSRSQGICELGARYNAVEKEVRDLRISPKTEKSKSVHLEQEKCSLRAE